MTATLSKPIISQESGSKKLSPALYMVQTALYLTFCLAALESVFYLAHVGDSEYIKPDLSVGYKPMEGKTMTQRREGFGTFTFNSFGMQNDQLPLNKEPGTLRIAVLGDSYVESIQVDRKANYCSLLAADLSKKLNKKVEVLNFGVANYSIAQDYLRYQNLARKFAPDLVILGFRVEEVVKLLPEPTNKLMSVRPVFFPGKDGKLLYDNTCVRNFFGTPEGKRINNTYWLRRNSRIWGVIGSLVQNLSGVAIPIPDQAKSDQTNADRTKAIKAPPASSSPVVSQTAEESRLLRAKYTNCYWYLMEAQLRTFAQACRDNHSQMMILRTPSGNINETETALLQKTASALGVSVLNLDQRYKQEFSPADSEKHFLGHGHFTALMHKWVEKRLADFLIEKKSELLSSGPAPQSSASQMSICQGYPGDQLLILPLTREKELKAGALQ